MSIEVVDASVTTRAGLRRVRARVPEGQRRTLLEVLMQPVMIAPLAPARVIERLMAYLLDPLGRAMLAVDDELVAWFAGSPLLRPVGPGAAAPLADDLAAALVAPMLARAGELPEVLWRWRWSPRADELIAATVAELPPAAGQAALARLLAEAGPDEERVHQAKLQAGRAVAWSRHLDDTPEAEAVVRALTPLLDRSTPRPLLAEVAAVLAPVAARRTLLGERVRIHALTRVGVAVEAIRAPAAAAGGRFSEQLAALDAPASSGELEKARRMPDWELAEHAAHLLGAGAAGAVEPWPQWLAQCLKLFGDLPLLPAFIDGLCAAAALGPVAEMVDRLASGDEDDRAMAADLSTLVPVDGAAAALRRLLQDPREPVRAAAVDGLALVGDDESLAAVEVMLADPAPEVAAAAALALVEHGRGAACVERAAKDASEVRRAALRAATGRDDTETIGELTLALVAQLDDEERREDVDGSPLLRALRAALFTTPAGLERAAALVGGIPDALPVLAFAVRADDGDGPGVLAPPDALAALDAAMGEVAGGDDEVGALALSVLAALSCGDEALAARVSAALAETEGFAGPLVAALADLRVRSPDTAAALAPLLGAGVPLAGRVVAAAAAGRSLPVEHPAWADVAALLELGTIGRAAAWTSLRDRVRYRAG